MSASSTGTKRFFEKQKTDDPARLDHERLNDNAELAYASTTRSDRLGLARGPDTLRFDILVFFHEGWYFAEALRHVCVRSAATSTERTHHPSSGFVGMMLLRHSGGRRCDIAEGECVCMTPLCPRMCASMYSRLDEHASCHSGRCLRGMFYSGGCLCCAPHGKTAR